ncbi:MAG TPA: hypothetical protein PLN52_01630 [Opitutaceae bacterium]|nr:hypothetical protein [Opitutaceae bacterium]
MPAESDWKKFRAMVPKLRERYLAPHNARLAALLTDPKKTETERFWDTLEEMKREVKVLEYCLDGHSRSKMWLFMLPMIRCGMLKKDDLADFSDDLKNEILYAFDEKKG